MRGTRQGRRALVTGCCAVMLLGGHRADAQVIGYTASLYGVRGTYPTEGVDSVYVFNGVDVTTLETSDGSTGERAPSRLRTGTMLGLVGGGIVGGIWAYRSSSDDARGAAPLVMSLVGVGIGAGIGALLDAAR